MTNRYAQEMRAVRFFFLCGLFNSWARCWIKWFIYSRTCFLFRLMNYSRKEKLFMHHTRATLPWSEALVVERLSYHLLRSLRRMKDDKKEKRSLWREKDKGGKDGIISLWKLTRRNLAEADESNFSKSQVDHVPYLLLLDRYFTFKFFVRKIIEPRFGVSCWCM